MTDHRKGSDHDKENPAEGKPPTDPTDKLSSDNRKGSDGTKPQDQRNHNDKIDTTI